MLLGEHRGCSAILSPGAWERKPDRPSGNLLNTSLWSPTECRSVTVPGFVAVYRTEQDTAPVLREHAVRLQTTRCAHGKETLGATAWKCQSQVESGMSPQRSPGLGDFPFLKLSGRDGSE